jgi:tetratricopeptide (TPR) repeat protein
MKSFSRKMLSLLFCLSIPTGLSGQVEWVPRYEEALKKAAANNQLVVIVVSASWCPPCREMEKQVFIDQEFTQFSRCQVFMHVDTEDNREGTRIAEKFEVGSFPTILILNSKGEEIDRLSGGRSTQGLIKDLKEVFSYPVPIKVQIDKAKAEPDNFELQLRVGRHFAGTHQPDRAIPYLKRAASNPQSGPDQVLAFFFLARACFENRNFPEALNSIESLERTNPQLAGSGEVRLFKARTLYALRRYDEVSQTLDPLLRASDQEEKIRAQKLIAQMPAKFRKTDEQANKLLDKATKSFNQGKVAEAQALVKRAADFSTLNPDVPMLQALIQFRLSKNESDPARQNQLISSGLNYMRVARRLDPGNITTYLQSENVLASRWAPSQPANPEAQKSFAKAEQAFAQENYQEAAAQYGKTLQLDPSFGKAYLHCGDCFFAVGQKEEALKWYQKAIEKTPLDAATYRFAADALVNLGRKDEAHQMLINGLLADPEYPLIWRDLANFSAVERHHQFVPLSMVMLGLGTEKYEEALFQNLPSETIPAWQEYARQKLIWRQEKFKQEFPQAPFDHESCKEEADCLGKLTVQWQRMKEKNPSLKNGELDFLSLLAMEEMLEAFVYLERFSEEYRREYEKWKKEKPEMGRDYLDQYVFSDNRVGNTAEGYSRAAIIHYNAGVKKNQEGQVDAAILEYSKALSLEPGLRPALHNLSLILMQKRDWERAHTHLQKWSGLAPEEAMPLALLAQVAFAQSKPEEAITLLNKAAELEKDLDRKKDLLMQAAQLRGSQAQRLSAKPTPQNLSGANPLKRAQEALQENEPEEAIEILLRELDRLQDPREKDQAIFMLAFANVQAKKWKEAHQYLAQYLGKYPSDQRALSLQDHLKAMDTAEEDAGGASKEDEKPILRRR